MSRRWLYVAITAVLAAAAAAWAIPQLGRDHGTIRVWVRGDDLLGVSLATHVDGLAAQLMLLAVGVGLLVQIYSTAYLGHHPRYRSYALLIVLFLIAMLTVAVADDFLMLLVGWEVMGLCSYLLIGHEWQIAEARSGAAKAFLMTWIPDLGLLVGIIVIGQTYGTYRISEVLAQEPKNSTAIGLLLLLAVVGKSAQFPLHTWLPDAMPGPTPITALIHAATMVAAGVYLIARLLQIFADSTLVMLLLALVAGITMLIGALFALAQTDLKRALAWSTVSQLAFMFAALAADDRDAAISHLLSHGAFKALLFLGCGCLMYAVGSSSLAAMGGLRRTMPVTFWSMTIGFAALAGMVPTAGFFSKDGVLAALHQATDGTGTLGSAPAWMLFVVALATSLVTATYATRLWLMAFFGSSPVEPVEIPQEAPLAMTGPVVLLAGATLALSIGQPVHVGIGMLSTTIAVAGIGLIVWARHTRGDLDLDFAPLTRELDLDVPYARWLPAVVGTTARLVVAVDRDGVDVYPRSSATVAELASRALDLLQSRNVQRYATVITAGVTLLTIAAVIWT